MEKEKIEKLIESAFEARKYSYSPYSNFAVGAAVLTLNEKVFTGCNIESASFTPTICAERTAISKAVSEGEKKFKAVAIVGSSEYTYPCGVCRQFMREFGKELTVIVANSISDYKVFSLEQLFPCSFGPEDLKSEERKI